MCWCAICAPTGASSCRPGTRTWRAPTAEVNAVRRRSARRRRAPGARRPRLLAALLAGAIAIGVATTADMIGAFGRAEDATVDLRFDLRGPSVPADVLVVAIDDATFSDLGRALAVPPLPSREGHRPPPRRGCPRDRLRRPVHRADQATRGPRALRRGRAGGPRRARHHGDRRRRRDERPRRRREPQERPRLGRGGQPPDLAGRRHPPGAGIDRRTRHDRGAHRREPLGAPSGSVPVRGSRRPDRLPRPARHRPGRLVLRSREGPGRPRAHPRQGRRGRRVGAQPPGRARHPDRHPHLDVGTRDPGQRDLDGDARVPAARRPALGGSARPGGARPSRHPLAGLRLDARMAAGSAVLLGAGYAAATVLAFDRGRSCRSSRPSRRARSGSCAASRRATGWRAGSGGG